MSNNAGLQKAKDATMARQKRSVRAPGKIPLARFRRSEVGDASKPDLLQVHFQFIGSKKAKPWLADLRGPGSESLKEGAIRIAQYRRRHSETHDQLASRRGKIGDFAEGVQHGIGREKYRHPQPGKERQGVGF